MDLLHHEHVSLHESGIRHLQLAESCVQYRIFCHYLQPLFLEELQPDRSFPKLIVLEKVMEQLFEYLFLNLEGLKHDRLNF